MSEGKFELSGPDFTHRLDIAAIPDSDMLLGRVLGEAVLLARLDEEIHAIGATCAHYDAAWCADCWSTNEVNHATGWRTGNSWVLSAMML